MFKNEPPRASRGGSSGGLGGPGARGQLATGQGGPERLYIYIYIYTYIYIYIYVYAHPPPMIHVLVLKRGGRRVEKTLQCTSTNEFEAFKKIHKSKSSKNHKTTSSQT